MGVQKSSHSKIQLLSPFPATFDGCVAALDINDPNTWPMEIIRRVTNLVAPLGEDEDAVNAISHSINTFDMSDKRINVVVERTRNALSNVPSFIAYHSCRPLDEESYRQHGLLTTTKERLRSFVKEYAGDIPGWESACRKAFNLHGIQDYVDDWYEGRIGLSFLPFKSYAKHGSLFLNNVLAQLGDSGKKRRKEIIEKTRPTVLVCELPRDWVLGAQTGDDLLRDYVAELLLSVIAHMRGRKRNQCNRAIHLCVDLPPDKIIAIREMKIDETDY
jgi:hypothetical protein